MVPNNLFPWVFPHSYYSLDHPGCVFINLCSSWAIFRSKPACFLGEETSLSDGCPGGCNAVFTFLQALWTEETYGCQMAARSSLGWWCGWRHSQPSLNGDSHGKGQYGLPWSDKRSFCRGKAVSSRCIQNILVIIENPCCYEAWLFPFSGECPVASLSLSGLLVFLSQEAFQAHLTWIQSGQRVHLDLKKNQLIEGLEQRREQKKALFALGVCSNFSTNETSRIFWQIPEQNFKLGIPGQSLLSYNLPLLTCLLSAYLPPSLQSKSRELWLRVRLSAKYLWLANDNMVLINLFTEIIWYRKRSAFLAEKLCVCFWHCTYIIAGSGSHQPSKMKSLHESLMKKTTFLSDGSPSGFVCTGAPNRNQHLLKALIWQHRTVV